MEQCEPSFEAAIRVLAAEVADRIRRGESREAVRASLVADGLTVTFADGLLAGIAEPIRAAIGPIVAVALTATAFAVLPVAGAITGVWLVWSPPSGEACGLWVLPALFMAGCTGLLGLAAGVGLAFAALWGVLGLLDR